MSILHAIGAPARALRTRLTEADAVARQRGYQITGSRLGTRTYRDPRWSQQRTEDAEQQPAETSDQTTAGEQAR